MRQIIYYARNWPIVWAHFMIIIIRMYIVGTSAEMME